MNLYHVLSKRRLAEKLDYARAHGGRLLLSSHHALKDSAEGALPEYIHLLPNLVGGITFSNGAEAAVLRVTLGPTIVPAELSGASGALDLRAAAERAPILKVRWDEPGLCFHEWLLTSSDAVSDWTCDPDEIRRDFVQQLADLRAGTIGASTFFYPDMDPRAQLGMAELIGARHGFHELTDDPAELRARYESAIHRLGLGHPNATKNLFFVGPPFLALARRLATPEWAPDAPFAALHLTAPWTDLDGALTTGATRLLELLDLGLEARGPLEVRFVDPSLERVPGGVATVRLGVRSPVRADLPADLAWEAGAAPTATLVHHGRLWDLEDAVLAMAAGVPAVRELSYVLHAFTGARQPENRVRVSIGG